MDTESNTTSTFDSTILEEMYLFSRGSKCILHPIKGEVYEFDVNQLTSYDDNYSKRIALSRKAPVNYLGDEYLDLYTDCTPCLELMIKNYGEAFREHGPKGSILEFPLVKIKENDNREGSRIAYKSGKRSAIYECKSEGKPTTYYRLKGCGNLD